MWQQMNVLFKKAMYCVLFEQFTFNFFTIEIHTSKMILYCHDDIWLIMDRMVYTKLLHFLCPYIDVSPPESLSIEPNASLLPSMAATIPNSDSEVIAEIEILHKKQAPPTPKSSLPPSGPTAEHLHNYRISIEIKSNLGSG